VLWWSTLEAVAVISVTVLQLVYLKRFFEIKRSL